MQGLVSKTVTRQFYSCPLLVVGTGRSGTSPLRSALGRHPEIVASLAPESPVIAHLGGLISACALDRPGRSKYVNNNMKVSPEGFYETLRRLCFESAMGPGFGSRYMLKLLAKSVYRREPSPIGARFWCVKPWFSSPAEFDGLFKIFPDMRIVYIIRNGIDVVQSRSKYPSMAGNGFVHHCQTWKDDLEIHRCLSNSQSAIEVRQEDLMADPEGLFGRVFDFLGLNYDPRPADFIRNNLLHPLDRRTQSGVDVSQSLNTRPPAYEEWTPEQRETFKRICGDAMREVGYEIPF